VEFNGAEVLEQMKAVFLPVVQAMVDSPEDVYIEGTATQSKTVFISIKSLQSDSGKIIGRSGRNADALRTLLSAVGGRYRARVILEIVEG